MRTRETRALDCAAKSDEACCGPLSPPPLLPSRVLSCSGTRGPHRIAAEPRARSLRCGPRPALQLSAYSRRRCTGSPVPVCVFPARGFRVTVAVPYPPRTIYGCSAAAVHSVQGPASHPSILSAAAQRAHPPKHRTTTPSQPLNPPQVSSTSLVQQNKQTKHAGDPQNADGHLRVRKRVSWRLPHPPTVAVLSHCIACRFAPPAPPVTPIPHHRFRRFSHLRPAHFPYPGTFCVRPLCQCTPTGLSEKEQGRTHNPRCGHNK